MKIIVEKCQLTFLMEQVSGKLETRTNKMVDSKLL